MNDEDKEYSIAEIKKLVTDYIAQHKCTNPANKSEIIVDEVLSSSVFRGAVRVMMLS
jgi:chromatin remodeling complex protein RSC6